MSTITTTVSGHIAVIDGKPTTTTQDIAEVYGKQHAKVLAVVRQRMAEVPADWCLANFGEASIEVKQPNGGTATYPVIRMTKKGFHFVVGKFTGSKAVAHQIAFADEFERMERELSTKSCQLPALGTPETVTVGAHNLRALIQMARLVHHVVLKEGLYEALDTLGAHQYAARLYSIAQESKFAAGLVEHESMKLKTRKAVAA